MGSDAKPGFQGVSAFLSALADVQAFIRGFGVAGSFGGQPEDVRGVLRAVDNQPFLEELINIAFLQQPPYVLFALLARLGYNPESNTPVAQLLEYAGNLRVDVQP